MNALKNAALWVSVAGALCAGAMSQANAADVMRIPEARPNAPFVALAAVPPGFTT